MMSRACRETGRQLQKQWLDAKDDLQSTFRQAFREAAELPKSPRLEFVGLLMHHARGDSQHLTKYLRSKRPLTRDHRELLAQVLEGVLDRKTKRGRPRNAEREAAFHAHHFFKTWVAENRTKRISDYGSRGLMKDEAVRFIVEEFTPSERPLKGSKIREILDRPKHRRNLS